MLPDSVAEIPVMDPRAFLLHRANHEYLNGQRGEPLLSLKLNPLNLLFLIASIMGILMGAAIMGGGIVWGSNVGITTAIGMVLFLMSLGVGGWAMQSSMQGAARRAGRVLEGTIIEAEKIRIQHGQRMTESIGVRYEFTAPEGQRLQSRAEAPLEETGRTSAPAPGTRVYIWYESEERYFLL